VPTCEWAAFHELINPIDSYVVVVVFQFPTVAGLRTVAFLVQFEVAV